MAYGISPIGSGGPRKPPLMSGGPPGLLRRTGPQSPVSAVSMTTSSTTAAHWQDGDFVEYNGDTENWGIDTEDTAVSSASCYPDTLPGGWIYYPQDFYDVGDVVEVWIKAANITAGATVDTRIYIGGTDPDNTYELEIDWRSWDWALYRVVSGERTEIGFGEIHWYEYKWYKWEFELDAAGLQLRAPDGGAYTDDTTYQGGGYGIRQSVNDERQYFRFDGFGSASASGGGGGSSYLEGFEDGDLAEYSYVDTNDYQISTNAQAGDYSLRFYQDSDTYDTGAMGPIVRDAGGSMTGQGEKYELYIQEDNDSLITRFLFGVQDADNHYRIDWDHYGGMFDLYRIEGGSSTQLAHSDAFVDLSGWVRYTIDWQSDGTIVAAVPSESVSISATDTTWASGGIGFEANDIAGPPLEAWWDSLDTI